jgi:hypothetical protein
MLKVYVSNILSISDVYCIQVFHVARVSCFSVSQGAQGSDGGMARAPENGAQQAGGRRTWCTTRWGSAVGGTTRRGAPVGRGERMRAGRIEADEVDCKRVV